MQTDKLRKWARVHAELLPFENVSRSKECAFIMQHEFIKTGTGDPAGPEVLERFRSEPHSE